MKRIPLLLLALLFFAHPAQAQSVTLTWTASVVSGTHAAATSYQVWRGTTAGSEVLLTTIGTGGNVGNVTTATDSTVTPGTTYFYEVFGLNAFGPGGPSNEASAVIPASTPTGPPAPPTITITITLPTT